jgi:hypothetical protein
MFTSKIGKTKELDEEKYNQIVQVKLNYKRMSANKRTKNVCNFFNQYELHGNQPLVCKEKGKLLPCAVIEKLHDYFKCVRLKQSLLRT